MSDDHTENDDDSAHHHNNSSRPVAAQDLVLLADWLQGHLDPGSAQWTTTFADAVDTSRLPAPPPLVRQRLRQSFRDWRDGQDGRSPASTPAVLAFDSRVDRASRAVRGTADRNTIHLAYRADPAELVLDVRMLGDGCARVDGQVYPSADTDAPVFEVLATSPGAVIRVVDGDQLGRFRIASMPLDCYELVVTNGEFTVSAPLDLRVD